MKALSKKWLIVGVGVIAVVLALGIGMGGGVALAQTPQPTPQPAPEPAKIGQNFMAALAQRLNIPVDTLQQAVKDAAKDTVKQAEDAGKLTAEQANKLDQLIDAGKLPQVVFALRARAAKALRAHTVAGEITAINGTALALHNPKGDVTVQTDSQTRFHVPGKPDATLADFRVHDRVAVAGARQSGNTVTARLVTLVPGKENQARGTVTAISGTTLTVHTPKGDATVQTNDATAYRVPGKDNPTLADVHVNDRVAVFGEHQADGSLLAKYIAVEPASPQQ